MQDGTSSFPPPPCSSYLLLPSPPSLLPSSFPSTPSLLSLPPSSSLSIPSFPPSFPSPASLLPPTSSSSSSSSSFAFQPSFLSVWQQRHFLIGRILSEMGAKSVLDFGCNDGKFLKRLTFDPIFTRLAGGDIDSEELQKAKIKLEPDASNYVFRKERSEPLEVRLFKVDVLQKSEQLKKLKFEAITAIELIEHLFLEDLTNFEENVFGYLEPGVVVITTPNRDFNAHFPDFDKRKFRHSDHKFEFSRKEFSAWCQNISEKFSKVTQSTQKLNYSIDYIFELTGVGIPNTGNISLGHSSQIAIFKRKEGLGSSFSNKRNENMENLEEIACFIYPYYKKANNLKMNLIEGIKYAYSFLKSYGGDQSEFISLNKICSFEKVENLLNQKKLFEILSKIELEKENIHLNSQQTHIKVEY